MIVQCSTCINGRDCLDAIVAKGYDFRMWGDIQDAARKFKCVDYWPERVYGGNKR